MLKDIDIINIRILIISIKNGHRADTSPSFCHLGENHVTTGNGVRDMGDAELYEDKHDSVVCDLLGQLEEECYSQLVKKVANASINALMEARHIVHVMKAVGLV